MYIIVVGGGRVGYHLTKALLSEGHEILLVEKSAAICDRVNEELGSICFNGDGCEAATLAEVGTGRADMFIAVTGDDEDNMVACQVAKHKFNVPRTVARIRNPQNKELFQMLGVDVAVSTTNIILEQIEEEVPTHPLTHLFTLKDSGLEMVEIKIPSDAKTAGKAIKDLHIPEDCKVVLLIPVNRRPILPNPDMVIEGGEQIIALAAPEQEAALRAALRGDEPAAT